MGHLSGAPAGLEAVGDAEREVEEIIGVGGPGGIDQAEAEVLAARILHPEEDQDGAVAREARVVEHHRQRALRGESLKQLDDAVEKA